MALLDDLKQMAADNAAAVQANTSEIGSIAGLVQGILDRLGLVEQALKDAIAAGDPAKIQEALDALTAERASIDAQKAALDALQNTASAPAP